MVENEGDVVVHFGWFGNDNSTENKLIKNPLRPDLPKGETQDGTKRICMGISRAGAIQAERGPT